MREGFSKRSGVQEVKVGFSADKSLKQATNNLLYGFYENLEEH